MIGDGNNLQDKFAMRPSRTLVKRTNSPACSIIQEGRNKWMLSGSRPGVAGERPCLVWRMEIRAGARRLRRHGVSRAGSGACTRATGRNAKYPDQFADR